MNTQPLKIHTIAVREDGCFSVLLWEGRPVAVSVERTFDAGNHVVLPGGIVRCTRTEYHKGGYQTFELHVEGHERVLFHKGNKEEDSLACVVVGNSFGDFDPVTGALGQRIKKGDRAAVLDSAIGFEKFMALCEGLDEFNAEVYGR